MSILCRKPGAVEHTRFFWRMPQQWQSFLAQTSGKERKNALQLLSEIVDDGMSHWLVMRWSLRVRTAGQMQIAYASVTT